MNTIPLASHLHIATTITLGLQLTVSAASITQQTSSDGAIEDRFPDSHIADFDARLDQHPGENITTFYLMAIIPHNHIFSKDLKRTIKDVSRASTIPSSEWALLKTERVHSDPRSIVNLFEVPYIDGSHHYVAFDLQARFIELQALHGVALFKNAVFIGHLSTSLAEAGLLDIGVYFRVCSDRLPCPLQSTRYAFGVFGKFFAAVLGLFTVSVLAYILAIRARNERRKAGRRKG